MVTEETFAKDEIKKIQEGLSSEKMKTQDLEQKLAKLMQAEQGETLESENLKLKRLILTFRKKYQRALQDLAKKGDGQTQETSPKNKKYQEAEEENTSLIEQQNCLKKMLSNTQRDLDEALKKTTQSGQLVDNSDQLDELRRQLQQAEVEAAKFREEAKETQRKLKYAEEAAKNTDKKNRLYEEQLGYFVQDESGSTEQKEIEAHKERIEKLEEENKKLQDTERELKEKIWLAKEELHHTKEEGGNADSVSSSHCSSSESLNESEEFRLHGEQLERAVVHLRTKSEEAQMEVQALQGDLHESQHQAETLRSEFLRLQSGEDKALEEKQLKIISLSEEKQKIESDLIAERRCRQELQNELEAMKQTLVQGLREAKEIKQYYQTLSNEKAATLQKNNQIQHHLKTLRAEIQGREKEIEEVLSQLEAVKKERGKLEKQLIQERDRESDFKREMQDRDENITSLAEQIQTIQSRLKHAQEIAKDKDHHVIEAKRHLAKKVREVAQFSERIEKQEREIEKLQEDLRNVKEKVTASHSNTETQIEQQKKLQEQLDAWEKKYFRVYERLQASEARNKELMKIEEKHEQMQQLLSSLGNVIGSPVGLTQPYGMGIEGSKSPEPTPKPKKPKKQKDNPEQQTFFDMPNPPSKHKNDLFE